MRKSTNLLLLVLTIVPTATSVTACTGDEVTAGADDGGTTTVDSGAAEPNAVATAAPAYVGNTVALDGSGSTGPDGLTYAWTVASSPPGSEITTASLSDATSAKPTFAADRPGEYTLKLTITSGSASASTEVIANVFDPPVFYFHSEGDSGAESQASLNVVGATGGDGGSTVSCFSSDAGSYGTEASQAAAFGADWWEAPAGQPSRAVFVFETREGEEATGILATTTSSATCASTPTKLDQLAGKPATTRAFEQPRLSPSGNRIVYVRNTDSVSRIATIGFEGEEPRAVAPTVAFPDGGPNPQGDPPATISVRPVWVNDTTVAWLQRLDSTHWQIVSAPDQADATPTLLMSCTGSQPSQFDVLPNGEILVSQTIGTGNDAVTDIVAYPITEATKECGTARNISQLKSTQGQSSARDFSLSPDKTRVAYIAYDDATKTSELTVAGVDGAAAPVSVAAPLEGGKRGPRWVGGGAFLSWGVEGSAFDAGIASSAVAVVAAGGGKARVAASSTGGEVHAIGNGSCSFAPAVGSGVGLFGAFGVLALRLVRRRRR